MTCNSESVKSWTACLLRSIVSKWVSFISFNASARSQNVAISWDINISQQLRQWAIDQLDEIIKMLIELKDQRDMTLKLNEQWIDLQVNHIKRLDKLKTNQMTINTQEEIIIKLQEKVLSLKKKQHSADQSQSQQSIESQSTMNHLFQQDIKLHASIKNHTQQEMFIKFISFENEDHQFYKFLNSFIFTDEDELTWKDWRNKMNNKLIVNVNQFNDEIICIIYMMFKLEDDAAKYIFAWRCFNSLNSFTSIYKLFNHLKEIYNELNKNWKSWREYNALKQADKSFNVFYFDFMKLFSYFNYNDYILMNDFQNKINNRLQNALSICSKNFTLLIHLRIFLQNVNNKQWVNYQLHSERCTIIVKVTVISDKHAATLLSVMTLIINYVKSIIFSIFKSAKSSIICYTCKILSHLLKNCFQNKIDTSAFQAFTSYLHEIIILKNKKNEKMSSFEDSRTKN